jgi:hypothetical protein
MPEASGESGELRYMVEGMRAGNGCPALYCPAPFHGRRRIVYACLMFGRPVCSVDLALAACTTSPDLKGCRDVPLPVASGCFLTGRFLFLLQRQLSRMKPQTSFRFQICFSMSYLWLEHVDVLMHLLQKRFETGLGMGFLTAKFHIVG